MFRIYREEGKVVALADSLDDRALLPYLEELLNSPRLILHLQKQKKETDAANAVMLKAASDGS